MTAALVLLGAALLALCVWEWVSIYRLTFDNLPKAPSRFLVFTRPFLGRVSSLAVPPWGDSKHTCNTPGAGAASQGPQARPPCGVDGRRQAGYALAVPLLLVSSAPDSDAFLGGFQVVLMIGFVLMVALIGLSILRRMLGS